MSREELAYYPPWQRRIEGTACALVFLSTAHLAWRLVAEAAPISWTAAPVGVFLGIVGADLASGIVHWACDTWGSLDTPLVGRTVLRSFREHHVDSTKITRHDFVETNGSNAVAALLPLCIAELCGPYASPLAVLGGTFAVSLGLFSFLTSQCHKWAHNPSARNPAFVRWLQRRGLAMSPEHHAIHHRPPHLGHYCITVGWCNPLLDRFQVFRRAEWAIARLTGAVPRAGDVPE